MKMLLKVLVILTTLSVVSCGGGAGTPIRFNPDFHRGDYAIEAIVNEGGKIVYCRDPLFNMYAAMHKEKIKERADILSKAVIPDSVIVNGQNVDLKTLKEVKKNYLQKLDEIILRLEN